MTELIEDVQPTALVTVTVYVVVVEGLTVIVEFIEPVFQL